MEGFFLNFRRDVQGDVKASERGIGQDPRTEHSSPGHDFRQVCAALYRLAGGGKVGVQKTSSRFCRRSENGGGGVIGSVMCGIMWL